jgi:threonine aldolase
MRAAMAEAEVGDDFYDEDPTVRALERRTAELVGTEDALFTVSGGMANLLAIQCLTSRGDSVVVEADSDLARWESHATAAFAGVQLTTVPGRRGRPRPEDVRAALAAVDERAPVPKLVVIENTHNSSGGSVWPLDQIDLIADVAHRADVSLVCDGARLFNACCAAGYTAADVGRRCAAVSVSLYKGLGAPMGALLCCSAAMRTAARRLRRMMGTTFRQVGIVAAAGLVALDGVAELDRDHRLAALLASRLREVLPETWWPAPPETNIVVLPLDADATEFVGRLRGHGVLVTEILPGRVRFVTHRDVGEHEVAAAAQACAAAAHSIVGRRSR